MTEEFGAGYVQSYDPFNRQKDYAGECDLIERILRSYGGPVGSVLDLGCGTASHAITLAQRGYEVVGVDRSVWMVAEAQRKIAAYGQPLSVTVRQGDVCTSDLQRRFDVVLMMYGVLGYQQEDADVLAAFGTARRHLESCGLLLFEVWFGPAVLRQGPATRVKTAPTPGGQVQRSASAELDIPRHVCTVHFHLRTLEGSDGAADTEEVHHVRYFFPDELEGFLKSSGFSLLRLGAFPAFDEEPDETTWNVLAVARAV